MKEVAGRMIIEKRRIYQVKENVVINSRIFKNVFVIKFSECM
jgi:hypothetical protein